MTLEKVETGSNMTSSTVIRCLTAFTHDLFCTKIHLERIPDQVDQRSVSWIKLRLQNSVYILLNMPDSQHKLPQHKCENGQKPISIVKPIYVYI